MSPSSFKPAGQKSSIILPEPLESGILTGLICFITQTASITYKMDSTFRIYQNSKKKKNNQKITTI